MADLSLTSSGALGPSYPSEAEIRSMIAAEAIVAGQSVYVNSAGKVALCNAGAAGTAKFRGIALESAGAGQAVSVLIAGELAGFNLSGLAYDAPVYLSNTAGALADAAGTVSVVAARVVPISDKDKTKVLRFAGFAG